MAHPAPAPAEDELETDTQDAFVLAMEEEKQQEHHEKRTQRQMRQRIQRIKSRVGLYVNITFNEMGAAGASDTANLLSGLQYINEEDESDVAGWERFVRMLFSEHLQSARVLHARMQRELDRGRGSISSRDEAEWESFYRSPSYDYKHKESQIEQVLPIEIDRAIAVRLERDRLLREANAQRVPASRTLQDDSVFLNLSLSARRTAVASFREDLRSLSGELDEAHGKLKHQLVAKASGAKACLPLDEAYRMLARAFDQAENAKDIERFERSVLRYEIARAEQVRADYDEAEGVLDRFASHIPPAFYRRTPASFLQLAVAGRAAYVESVRNAARAASVACDAEEAQRLAADAEEAAVKASLAAGDWKAAKIHVQMLEKLDPRRSTLMTLIHSVDEAEIAGQKEEAVDESRQVLERQVKAIGSKPLAAAYEAALAGGPERFASFTERLERGRAAEQAKEQAVVKLAVPAKPGEAPAGRPVDAAAPDAKGKIERAAVPTAKGLPVAAAAPVLVRDAKAALRIVDGDDDDEEDDEDKKGEAKGVQKDEEGAVKEVELDEADADEDDVEEEVTEPVEPVAAEDEDDEVAEPAPAVIEPEEADDEAEPVASKALPKQPASTKKPEKPEPQRQSVPPPAVQRQPQAEVKKAVAKPAPKPKKAVRAVAVEAKKTDDIAKTVETLDRREDDHTAIVLRDDGEAISDERQRQAAQLHEGFAHHLSVLQRHEATFRPEAKREAA